MTWTSMQANGRGEVAFRLSIERFPYDLVTHRSMAVANARLALLSVSGKLKCFSNPVTGELEVSGLRCGIIDPAGAASAIFGAAPARTTWLTAAVNSSVTSIPVRSTAGWPSEGYLWVDSECINYKTTTGTSFDTCTRGAYSSLAQSHYIAVGGAARYPEVTSSLTSLAGCRARLYAYGEGDDPTGAGTQIWLGVVTRHPTLVGGEWSLSIDPITSVLGKTLASDMQAPARPRGIVYNWRQRFHVAFTRADTIETISIALPSSTASADGFFETNAAMADYVNTKLEALLATWYTNFGCRIRMIPDGDSGYYWGFTSDATVDVQIETPPQCIDPRFFGQATDINGANPGSLTAGVESFWLPQADSLPGAGSVPRGYIGSSDVGVGGDFTLADAYPVNGMYLSGVAIDSRVDCVAIKWPAFRTEPESEEVDEVLTTTAATNRVTLALAPIDRGGGSSTAFGRAWTAAALPELRFGRTYTFSGNIYTALVAIIGLGPDGINLGAVPDIRSGDLDGSTWNLIDSSDQPRVVRSRRFTSVSSQDLIDIVKNELLMAGFMLGTSNSGKMSISPIRGVVRTEAAAFTILDNIIGTPTWEPSYYGMVNQVMIKRGYSAFEDKHLAPPVIVRNVAEFGRNPQPRTAEIAPLSSMDGAIESYDECVEAAQRIFSAFAGPYAVVTCTVPITAQPLVTIGTVVAITSPLLPDYETGRRGVSGLRGIVTGREIDLSNGRVSLRVLASLARTSGYVPETTITSSALVSGNTWDLTLPATHWPSGTFADNWFLVGDLVTARRWDSTSSTTLDGAVVSTSATVVRVTFTAAAGALAADSWYLTSRVGTAAISATQARYTYLGDTTMTVTLNGTDYPARAFA